MNKKIYEVNSKQVEILINEDINYDSALFKMFYPNSTLPHYYAPKHVFVNNDDVVKHICANLETDGIKIEVIKCDNKQIKY